MVASAPRSASDASTRGLRPAATIRPAPKCLASWTAIWPATPVAPRISTRSPGRSLARHSNTFHADTPGFWIAAASASSTPSGMSEHHSRIVTARSAMAPAGDLNSTRAPSGSVLTAMAPHTAGNAVGAAGWLPDARARSRFVSGQAVTRTTSCPSPGVGSGTSSTHGSSPRERMTAASTTAPVPPVTLDSDLRRAQDAVYHKGALWYFGEIVGDRLRDLEAAFFQPAPIGRHLLWAALAHRAAEEEGREEVDVDVAGFRDVLRIHRHQDIDLATDLKGLVDAGQDLEHLGLVEHVEEMLDQHDVETLGYALEDITADERAQLVDAVGPEVLQAFVLLLWQVEGGHVQSG